MFKQFSVYLAILALVLGPNLVASPALADSDKGEKNRDKQEKKLNKEEDRQFNKLLKTWFNEDKKVESEDDDNDEQDDDRLPRGLQHAPGIEKRLEDGKGLPFGWWLKLIGRTGTSTNATSTISFNLTKVAATVSTSTATITWQTNRGATSQLWYGTSSPLNASSSQISNSNLVFNHSFNLTSLTPNTTYYYQVSSTNNAGVTATSSTLSFTTAALPVADTEAPNIIFSTILNVSETSARLIWVTNEASNSKVWVSTSTPINLSLSPNSQNGSLTYYHDLTVTGLTASTTYHYALGGSDNAGNLATSTGTLLTH